MRHPPFPNTSSVFQMDGEETNGSRSGSRSSRHNVQQPSPWKIVFTCPVMMDADLWMVSPDAQEPNLRVPRGDILSDLRVPRGDILSDLRVPRGDILSDLRKATKRSPEDLVPNWVLDKEAIITQGGESTTHPTWNDLYQRGISPQEFRLVRQGNSHILRRLDGRVWSTAAVPRLIDGAMVFTNGVKHYKLSHTTRAPWETSHENLDEDLTIFANQQKYEINRNLLDDFSLSYSFYKT